MTSLHRRVLRRPIVAGLAASAMLGAYWMQPAGAHANVDSTTGGAFGVLAEVSLFGQPQPPNGPTPSVTLPTTGGAVEQTDADGHTIAYGPAVLFDADALMVSSSGTTGANGSVTSTARVVGDPVGVDPFRWSDLVATCTAGTSGATGSVSITGGTVTSTTGVTSVPSSPAPGLEMTGVVPGANDNFRIVFNEQSTANGVLTVTAAHLYLLGPTGTGHLAIGQVRCGVVTSPLPHNPVANDDAYSTAVDTPLMVAAPGVLANDTDADGPGLTAGMPTTPTSGAVVLNADGSFTYTPAAGFTGTATFEYMVHDPTDRMDTGLVSITVGDGPPPPPPPTNQPPDAVDDSYSTAYQTPLTVNAPGVLANDTDPDGNALLAGMPSVPTSGAVSLNTDGSFTYTPAAGFSGTATFTYMTHDTSNAMDTATVTVTVGAAPPPPPPSADVSVAIVDSTDPVNTRGSLTYTITVSNAGPDTAAGVSAFVIPPVGVRVQSVSGAACVEVKGRNRGLSCDLGDLAAEGSTTFTVGITAPTKPGTLSATATASSSTADPNPANNSATQQTGVVRP